MLDFTGDSGPQIIAEIGANHNGDMNLARAMIAAAKSAGAHAVKFQSWSEKTLLCREGYEREPFYDAANKHRHTDSLRNMVRNYQLTPDQHRELKAFCAEKGTVFMSSVFSAPEVALLEELDAPCHKIASMDVNNPRILDAVAATHKPVLISTGMATFPEVRWAVERLYKGGCKQVIPMHCKAIYPVEPPDVDLLNLKMLQDAFGRVVGYSDHTRGIAVALASVTLGAVFIEKHFTLDRDLPGWDHWFSAEPKELMDLCSGCNEAWQSLGSYTRTVNQAEREKLVNFRRSLVLTRDLHAGHMLGAADLDAKRPAIGIPPSAENEVVGRILARDMHEDDLLRWGDLA
jgi:N-acetylneuraminate synthase